MIRGGEGAKLGAMRSRKRAVYRFSGAPTWDPSGLREVLVGARSVWLSWGGFQVFAEDQDADVLDEATPKYVAVLRHEDGPRIDEPGVVAELVEAVAVTEVTDFLCMCTGQAAAEFFDAEGKLIAVVRFDFPSRIEWPHWPGQAHVADPERLRRWFATHYSTAVTGGPVGTVGRGWSLND